MRHTASILDRFLARLVRRLPAAGRVLRKLGWRPGRRRTVCEQLEFRVISKF